MHPIIQALGTTPGLPAEYTEAEIVKKILNDTLVTLRAQERMVEFFGAVAIEQMNPLERAALIKRIAPNRAAAAVAKNAAVWTMHEAISNGAPYLQGLCNSCKQDLRFPGPAPRDHGNRIGISKGDVTKALDGVQFCHCGHIEKLPADFRAYAEKIFQRIVTVTEE